MSNPDLLRTIHEWDRAMIANDADAIGRFMADEWTIVALDGSVGGKEKFLSLVRAETGWMCVSTHLSELSE